jgi:hypothetical protein
MNVMKNKGSTLASGARQFVVHDALERISILGSYVFYIIMMMCSAIDCNFTSLTPITPVQ